MNNPDNFGLDEGIDAMEDIYEILKIEGISISRADLWAIGGRAGAEWGMEGMPGNANFVPGDHETADFVTPFEKFKFGRQDCPSSPYTDEEFKFPNPHLDYSGLMKYFKETFGFTEDQSVAILGKEVEKNTFINRAY